MCFRVQLASCRLFPCAPVILPFKSRRVDSHKLAIAIETLTWMENRCCNFLKRNMMLILTVIVSIDFVAMLALAKSTAVVNTTSGPVRGEILSTFSSMKYASFLGIRYGKAPVGYLRFKPPLPADPWTEIFDVTDDGEPCMQYNASVGAITGSEDCLFLNVYTPVVDLAETPKNLKSVLFRMYGGAFLTGTSSAKIERPDYFLNNDIVYVSLNFRSGLFGYLALGIANATGNVGLKDVVLGLKWVKANIEKFGGNPNNVTILGLSSGGAMVDYLVLSESAAGLFHAAIGMSGSAVSTWAFQTPAKALSQAERLANLMGLTWTDRETLLQAFYDAPAEDIVNATTQIAITFGPFTPTIENESIATDVFLTRHPVDKYIKGKFTKVPHILGYVDQETVTFMTSIVRVLNTLDQCLDAAQQLDLTLAPSIISAYNALNSSTDFAKAMNYTELQKFINDSSYLLYIAPIELKQKILTANNDNNSVYYYHLSYFVPGPHHTAPNNTLPGSGHGDDLRFLYYIPTENYTDNPVANRTVHRVTTMWSNFVKYSNPTPDWLDNSLNFIWPDSGPSGLLLNIGSELTLERSTVSNDAKSLERPTWPHLSLFIFLSVLYPASQSYID